MKAIIFLVISINVLFANIQEINLNEAIKIALENNKQSKVSKLGLEIAKVQYEQALSANYPAINAMLVGKRLKENKINEQKGELTLSQEDTAKLISTLTGNQVPSSMVKPLSLPTNLDAKVMGRDTVKGSLNILYPLFTGGKISSIIEQAKLNKLLAANTIRRDELSVVFDIKKYFYGYVLTNELYNLANSTLKKMQFVSNLTKQFYENGSSLNIKKTDYLSVQLTVTLIESVVSKLELNRAMVKSALTNTMGLSWDSEINPIYSNNELLPANYILNDLVSEAYKSNSDISKMDIALNISEQQIKEKQAAHYPTVALMGELSHTYNSYEYGYLNENQANSWNIGFAVNIPLFDGLKTTNSVNEKKLEKKKMYLLQDMLKDGVALQIKNELTKASIGFKQIQTLKKSKKLAKDNRELNIRAYEIDAVETEKVIQAQYIEAYVKADYLKYVHDYLISLATIDNLIGKAVR